MKVVINRMPPSRNHSICRCADMFDPPKTALLQSLLMSRPCQWRQVKYGAGETVTYPVLTLQSNGAIGRESQVDTIDKVRGGGFYGKVLLLRNQPYVIKTAQPDPIHDLLRSVAWKFQLFPSQVSERAAQLDSLATNLISDALPIVTAGRFCSPRSFGYTRLPNGYAQLIERVTGRGPKFSPENEFETFRQAQVALTDIAYSMGLEQSGQVHPNNPFAMANIWFDDSRRGFVWLDTLAAFKHEPVFGLVHYDFHQDIRKRFYPDDPNRVTYNRIHTDMFSDRLRKIEDRFDPEIYRRIMDNLQLYQELIHQEDGSQPTSRDFRPALYDIVEGMRVLPSKVKDKSLWAVNLVRSIFDYDVRKKMSLEGFEKAVDLGFIMPDEATRAEEDLETHERSRNGSLRLRLAEMALAGFYVGTWSGMKFAEGVAYVANNLSDQDIAIKTAMNVGILIGSQAVSSTARFLGTSSIGFVSGVDLRAAARVSVVPSVGNVLPFAAQALVNMESKNSLIWHYAVRDYIAKLSSLHPAGGWGTQYEAELYNRLGPTLERLAVRRGA